MNFHEKTILIFGTGKSGIAAAELLQEQNAKRIIFDGNANLDEAAVREKSPAFSDAEIFLGDLPEDAVKSLDLAVLSPGVPLDLPLVERLAAENITLLGEIELAYQCGAGKLAAITGTNGKTTTTALTGALLKEAYKDVRIVGNIGIPYTAEAGTMTEETVTVAEISSFQLETALDFHPQVSALLNITPDHLDRHHSMEAYIAAKERITENQDDQDTVVLNYEDPVLREFGQGLKSKVVWFSSARELSDGLFTKDGVIYTAKNGESTPLIRTDELNILGTHNHENAMAAAAIALTLGVPREQVVSGLKKFTAVEHRIEFVAEKRGVRYYNDSKGTNPDAAIKAVRSMDRPIVLIGGGYDKNASYDEWVGTFPGRVKRLVLIGATAKKIAETCEEHGFTELVFADDLQEAVTLCAKSAQSGDAVLLSPACASWDMFPNYEVRGRDFKEFVHALED